VIQSTFEDREQRVGLSVSKLTSFARLLSMPHKYADDLVALFKQQTSSGAGIDATTHC
jgi:hypothetical protein